MVEPQSGQKGHLKHTHSLSAAFLFSALQRSHCSDDILGSNSLCKSLGCMRKKISFCSFGMLHFYAEA